MRPADGNAERRSAAPRRRGTLVVLRPIALALLGTLALTASAHASEPLGEQPAGTPGATEATETETAVAPPAPEATQEQAPSGAEGTPEQPAPELQSPPPEQVAEQPAPQPPAAEPPAPEPAPPAPVESTPEIPTAQTGEHALEPPPTLTLTEQTVESSPSGAGSEQTAKGTQPSATGATSGAGAAAAAASAATSPPVTIESIATSPSVPGEGATEPPIVTRIAGDGAAAAVAAKSAAFGSGPVGCALVGMHISGLCPELVSVHSLLSSAALDPSGSATSLAADPTDTPAGGGRGRSAVATPPISPSPGPQPGGASGGAASGGGGLALSGFVTLAGLLLLAAPRATRRLRLLCRPWRTACFALIPERPG